MGGENSQNTPQEGGGTHSVDHKAERFEGTKVGRTIVKRHPGEGKPTKRAYRNLDKTRTEGTIIKLIFEVEYCWTKSADNFKGYDSRNVEEGRN